METSKIIRFLKWLTGKNGDVPLKFLVSARSGNGRTSEKQEQPLFKRRLLLMKIKNIWLVFSLG